jgi:DNA-binding beta-propeller fold protein YncE
MPRLSIVSRRAFVALVVLLMPALAAGQGSFVNFESGNVRPLALSPDGSKLFAVNTPDNRLEIFTVGAGGLTLAAEVPVGLEPVAVASRTNAGGNVEAWVVNHLSDSVSIVELDPADVTRSRVTRTLLVGDEPRDIVFAGAGFSRAFITTARRGQNVPATVPANLTTPGTPRALVWAFDANNLGAALGGTPLSIIPCFGDTPRALAVSPDGTRVFAAVFHSGNRTTAIVEGIVSAGAGMPPALPGATAGAPPTSLVLKFNPSNSRWEDVIGRNWTSSVAFSLPDQDVFIINATANPPALLPSGNSVVGVGTVLFNMAVRPDNGKLYVTNLEARNNVRFEPLVAGGVQGHITESRITVINGTTPTARHLNPHVNYGVTTGPPSEVAQSVAFPTGLVFAPNGLTVFVTAFGSGKIAAIDTNALEAGTITEQLVPVGQGPSGLALDTANDRLYVMNRFDHTISVVSNASSGARAQTAVVPLRYDPSPAIAKLGRRFLYDGSTSGHGDNACASCHIFGDFDSLAWDLGDPFGVVVANPNPFRLGSGGPFHPAKGPMTTQSLRGMADAGPMHWRGDRTGGGDPGGNALDEDAAFKKFNGAFVGLLGRSTQLTATEMQQFADFALTLRYPPNPVRALDDVATAAQASALTTYTTVATDGGQTCNFCHRLPLGTDGFSSFEGEQQEFKIAHLRNAYQKVGMFGLPNGVLNGTGNLGNQVRGFGYLHDGSIPTVQAFLSAPVFNLTTTQRNNLQDFVLAFDSGLKPAVGQQVSASPATVADATVISRIDFLIARDDANQCDLVAKGVLAGVPRGWVYAGGNNFRSDRNGEALVDKTTLRQQAAVLGQDLTFTCVPLGAGQRSGVDRDEDSYLDTTELDLGSDPADPASVPPTATPTAIATGTATATITATPTATATNTLTGPPPTVTSTPTRTFTASATRTPTATSTATATRTVTATPTSSTTPTAPPPLDCVGGGVIQRAKLRVSRNAAPAGDEKITVKGEFVVATTSPAIDPVAHGLSFMVIDRASSAVLLSRTLPAGFASPGWVGFAPKWSFRDRDHVTSADGIDKALLRDRSSRTPGLMQFRLKGRDANFQLGTTDLELVVILGGAAEGSVGQCGRVAFTGAPGCTLSSSGNSLRCD